MPKKQKISKSRTVSKMSAENNNIFPQVKWGESYTSLFLGIVVVVVAAILVFSFLKGRNFNKTTSTQSTSTTAEQQANAAKELPKTYEVKEGDNLWTIAETIYGSGYNWVDLASANKMENPGLLYVGTKLIVPNAKPIIVKNTVSAPATTEQAANAITGDTYTVEKGDYLWEISVRAYGDGYKWVEIAKANSLSNPDLIFSGNVLKLPR